MQMYKQKSKILLKMLSILLITVVMNIKCPIGEDSDDDERKWTIMLYIDGDNKLEYDALNDINEMESTDLTGSNIDVIVLVDRISGYSVADGDWKGTRLYRITYDINQSIIGSERLADSAFLNLTATGDNEELNMGDPTTLSKFINFCKTNYSAQNYALILWNHGGGWRNRISDKYVRTVSGKLIRLKVPTKEFTTVLKKKAEVINRAICWDDTNFGDSLYMRELKSAIADKGINLIGFDACLMGMVEVAYELYGHANYLVASEEVEPSSGWAYQQLLSNFLDYSQKTAEDLGRSIVDSYADNTYGDITLSLVDLSQMRGLVTAINTFSDNLVSADVNDIISNRNNTQSFSQSSYIDLYHFAQNMSGVTGARNVITALNNSVVHHRQSGYSNSHGLSIFFPITESSDPQYSDYNSNNINFPGESQWDEFLAEYYSDISNNKYTIETFHDTEFTDTYLLLYDSNGNLIAENDDIDYWSGNYFSRIEISIVNGVTLYVAVVDNWNNLGSYGIQWNVSGGGSTGLITMYPDDWDPGDDTSGGVTVLKKNTIQVHYLGNDDQDWFSITP